MESYETGLLIILNYTHHLPKKIIIHHTIYIKKKKKSDQLQRSLYDVHCYGIATTNIDTMTSWYYISYVC